MKYIDLTHTFSPEIPVWPSDPKPHFLPLTNLSQHGYNTVQIQSNFHIGTHIDAPWHMLSNGARISEYSPSHFIGRGHLLDARGQSSLDTELLAGHNIARNDIVLIMTGYYKKFSKSEYFNNYPEITPKLAFKIIALGVKIVALDTPSPDRSPFRIHKMLLAKDILIIENLTNLEALLPYPKFRIIAIPPKIFADAAPLRVVAEIN